MVRKRDYWSSSRRRRRVRRHVPTEGWLLAELAPLAGVQLRTVQSYLERGALPSAKFYGTATRYGRPFLLRLLAIKRLRSEENLTLAEIGKRLALLTPAELEAFATHGLVEGPLSKALGLKPAPPPVAPGSGAPLSPAAESKRERWSRVVLLDGLEISIRDDANPIARRLANNFIEACLGSGT